MGHEATLQPDVIDGAEKFIRRFRILPEIADLPPATWTVACRRMQWNSVSWQEQPW
jgi:hypothetical protein